MQILQIDEHLVNVIVKATRDGLAMAGIKPVPIGVSKYFDAQREVSAIIGFAGSCSGSLMLNCSRDGAEFMAGSMIGEELTDLNPQTLDGICEIANIIAGQIKAILSTTEHKFEKISVPSIVVGSSYYIRNYKGMTSLSVDFEIPEKIIDATRDFAFSISMCLMKI